MRSAAIFLAGVLVGALLVAVIWPSLHPTTTYVAREDLVVSSNARTTAPVSFIVPKGTVFVHDTFFSEGFDSLKLYVNAADRDKFVIGKSKYDRIPCWVSDHPQASRKAGA